MRGLNKVQVIGLLGADPEMKYAANGNAIANVSVGVSEEWTDKTSGQKQEKTEWVRVVIFGKLAEIARDYLKKGSQVYFEGKLQTRKWQDQNTGQDRYTTEVAVDQKGQMLMLGGGNKGQGHSAPQAGIPAGHSQPIQSQQPTFGQGVPTGMQAMPPMQQAPAYPEDINDDDCPF